MAVYTIAAMMVTTQHSRLQFTCSETKPPATGPRTGPRELPVVKSANGTERWLWGQMSAKHPPLLVTTGDPKKPLKNRSVKRAARLGDSAQPMLKQKNRNMVVRKTVSLPNASESGANNMGPEANPTRKVVTPDLATVVEHANVPVTPGIAAAWILEKKVMFAVMNTMTIVAIHFLRAGQLNGCSLGSSLIW